MNLKRRGFCLLAILGVTASLHATPPIRISESNYRIQGLTAAELREQMNAKRPLDHGERFDANTEWYVKWHFDYRDKAQDCRLTGEEVQADIVYHLPYWTNEAKADSRLQNRWDNYLRHLRLHESGHARNGEQATIEIAAMLNNLASFSSCSLLEEVANERARQIIAAHNTWDREYDRETQHGKTQGAVFP